MAENTIVELKGVGFSYKGQKGFIEGLDISIKEKDFICLLGANGSGKSTILKLCSGILKPSGGSISLWGSPLGSYPMKDKAKLLSYLPQVLDMNLPFRVRELVGMGLYPYDIPPRMTVEDALGMVGLIGKSESYIRDLSGGERRRAFIAMTMLQGAGILLLDEPLANLDIKYQLELLRLLRGMEDLTLIMALHDINMAFQFDKVMLLKEGGTLAEGQPGDVLREGLLKEAFGVELTIRKDGRRSFISYFADSG
jgi:iron complex transport system ATP-binding protein